MPEANRRDTVQAVERAFRLLDEMASQAVPLSALELAAATGLNRTVVHRLLRTLTRLSLASDLGGRYDLGPEIAHLGYAYVDTLAFRRPALMYGIDLAQQIVERPWMVSIAAPLGRDVVLIDRIWGPETPLNTILDIGTRLDFDHSALGRTMLAYMADDAVTALVGEERHDALRRRLQRVRDNDGIDVARDEVQPGVTGVAAVVRDRRGLPVGSIAIAGPSGDRELALRGDAARRVKLTARNIERALPGFSARGARTSL